MGNTEIQEGVKARLHELVDKSDTESIFDIVSAIRESDCDIPYRHVLDLTPMQDSYLKHMAEVHSSDVPSMIRFILDAGIRGHKEAEINMLTGKSKKGERRG